MFNLQNFFGAALNGMRDGVTVRRAENERLQDQHIESSLQHLAAQGGFTFGHAFQSTPLDGLPESITDIRPSWRLVPKCFKRLPSGARQPAC